MCADPGPGRGVRHVPHPLQEHRARRSVVFGELTARRLILALPRLRHRTHLAHRYAPHSTLFCLFACPKQNVLLASCMRGPDGRPEVLYDTSAPETVARQPLEPLWRPPVIAKVADFGLRCVVAAGAWLRGVWRLGGGYGWPFVRVVRQGCGGSQCGLRGRGRGARDKGAPAGLLLLAASRLLVAPPHVILTPGSVPMAEDQTHASNRFAGTPAYAAPEVRTMGRMSKAADGRCAAKRRCKAGNCKCTGKLLTLAAVSVSQPAFLCSSCCFLLPAVYAYGVLLLELFHGVDITTVRANAGAAPLATDGAAAGDGAATAADGADAEAAAAAAADRLDEDGFPMWAAPPPGCPPEMVALLRECLSQESAARPSFGKVGSGRLGV